MAASSSSRSGEKREGEKVDVQCPGCGSEFDETAFELLCGHCVCKTCASKADSKTERPSTAASIASSTVPYIELQSVVFCEKHPEETVRYFCNICKIAICELCWKQNHMDWKKHNVSFLTVNLEPQKLTLQRLTEYKAEIQKTTQVLASNDWKTIVKQITTAENEQKSVLKSNSAKQLEDKSAAVRKQLLDHKQSLEAFKAKITDQFRELEQKYAIIFGEFILTRDNTVSCSRSQTAFAEGGYSSLDAENFASGVDRLVLSAGTSNQESISTSFDESQGEAERINQKEKKPGEEARKRELIGVKKIADASGIVIDASSVVYNSDTEEIITLFQQSFRVFYHNENNNQIELKREMEWKQMRNDATSVFDIATDIDNNLYVSLYRTSDRKWSVEIVNQNNLKMIKELDTTQLLNGDSSVVWFLCAYEKILIVAVFDRRTEKQKKWCSMTVYFDQVRQYTVPLDIKTYGSGVWSSSSLLVNDTTLILQCGWDSNKLAVISLPSHHQEDIKTNTSSNTTTREIQPHSIKYVRLSGLSYIFSLVWIPSSEFGSSNCLDWYLFATELSRNATFFRIGFEKELDQLGKEGETELKKMEEIPPLKNTMVYCRIDNSSVFALSETTEVYKGNPSILKLEFEPRFTLP
ncbi:uncharacterized protein LOC134852917 isoform X2 [Symsagittifera roscoffensis]|uniref:uncharacterized protein LOC134852917 isoform X2 n=1 Tax=Symsagittifera roscoffensis TaxID=84072 RepID=UPI00307BA093